MPTYKDLYYAATDDLANVINRKAGTTGKKDIPLMLQAAESIKSIEDGTLPVKTAADLTASGDTVTVPVGYYGSEAQKAVSHGSATTPATAITANPTITVDSQTGAISASVSESESVTPTVVPGYVASGTSGTVSVSGSASKQLPVQGAQTITPTTTDQTIAGGKYLTGAQKIEAVVCENLNAGNIKSGVTVKVGTATDDDSVVEITGEYEGGGGGDVTYSELITATYGGGSIPVPSNYKYVAVNPLSVNQNDTYNAPDNTAYDPVVVAVSGGGGKDHTFDIPTISGSYTYDGTPHIPTITGFYSDFMTLSGDVSETNAGSYMITVTLKDTTNCEWRDTTTTAKTLSWSIAKAALPKPTLSAATLSLNADNLTGMFTVSRSGDGVISAISADSAKVTASVSGDTVTVTLVDTTAVGSTVNITVMVAEGTNYLAYTATDVVCAVAIVEVVPQGYIVFVSEDGTSITVGKNGGKTWNGTVYYSTDGSTWSEWDGVTSISDLKVYLRGVGNTVISGTGTNGLTINGTNITCRGRIDALLDYTETMQGNSPQMGTDCYRSLFTGCTSLTTVQSLPATTLAEGCYREMFTGCTSLTTVPSLPATTLAEGCYRSMFSGCTLLTTVPSLPATTLVKYCYRGMFYNCISIKLSTTQYSTYPTEYRIPTTGTGTSATSALTDMFTGTGGIFIGTPTINTTYYTSNEVV